MKPLKLLLIFVALIVFIILFAIPARAEPEFFLQELPYLVGPAGNTTELLPGNRSRPAVEYADFPIERPLKPENDWESTVEEWSSPLL